MAGFLDYYQTPYDNKVMFCHSNNPGNYTFTDTSVSACLTHIGHLYDIFPTTICDS